MLTQRLPLILAIASAVVTLLACADEPGSSCTPGAASCECNGGQCFAGLVCLSNLCVDPGSGETSASDEASAGTDPSVSTSEATSNAEAAESSTAETTSGGCQGTDGTVDCPCLAGNACLGDLTCDSQQTCICLSGNACGESDCVDDFQTDDRHCGVCGNACATFEFGIGDCALGECTPTLSNCAPGDEVACDTICQAEGRTCVAQGCGGDMQTWIRYGAEDLCEGDAQEAGGFGPCSEVPTDPWIRCCCTP